MSAPKDGVPPAPSAALAQLSGTVLEQRYELGRVLGSGGMGAVFAARHLRLDRPVAIKVLRPMYAAEGEYVERFLREAKAASKIRHRNVVEIHDYGEAAGGLVYSVMEFLVGQDLQQLLSARPDKRIGWPEACGLLVQIASGLKAAHEQQVIHRDIKPANCFLTEEDGEPLVKLVDFGIARLEGGDRGATLTGTAQVLGTPSYIAPELVRTERPASPQSDMYALGVVAYRMLTGRVPFGGATVFEILRHACFDPVPSMRALMPELPEPVERFVMELLAKEPELRPADMQEVRRRLVALSRETLGAQAVVIPGSSGLPLSLEHSVPPPGSTEDTTVPREGAGGSTERPVVPVVTAPTTEQPVAREVGITAVIMEPLTEDRRPPASRPAGAPPPVIVAAPAGAPQGPVVDPTSAPGASPSRSGETVPAVGESTLRSLEQSGAIDRSRRKAGLWVGVGGVAVLGAVGALVVPAMMGDGDGSATVSAPEVAKANVEPAEGASAGGVEPSVSADDGGESLGALDDEPADEVAATVIDASTTETPSDDGTSASSDGEGLGDTVDTVVDPPSPAPADPPQTAEPKPKPKPAKTKPKASTKPAGPPKDSAVVKQLKRTIAKRCAKALGGGSVTIKFVVTAAGGVMGVNGSGPGGPCATLQVQGAKFQSRSKITPLKFTVE